MPKAAAPLILTSALAVVLPGGDNELPGWPKSM
jgi:hypothetical protein